MAETPEESLVQPDPAYPCFLNDLPPMTHGDGSSFDDLSLPYIARLLMEDNIEDRFFYQYPDHPALLRAQLPFAQILADESASSSGGGGNSTSTPSPSSSDATAPVLSGGGEDRAFFDVEHEANIVSFPCKTTSGFFKCLLPADQDMLNLAFLKGMEEAKKFLPNSGSFAVEDEEVVDRVLAGVRRKTRYDGETEVGRASKLMMPELEEDGARDLLDKMIFQEDEICMKGVIHDPHTAAMDKKKSGKKVQRRSGDSDEMVDLQTLLLRGAQAVSNDDRRSTTELLKQIKAASSPNGDAAQRLAHYFVEGLEARLAGTGSQLYQSLVARPTMVVDFLKAQHLFMSACCCKRVAYTFANKTIYDAAAGKSRLHVVDYGLNYGVQWPGLLRALAAREGGPPEVRITGIDLPQPGFHGDYNIHATGRRLANCARMLGVPFKFRGIGAKRETIKVEGLDIDRGEVLIVISLCHFRNLMDEEDLRFAGPNPRDQVLCNVREMRPDMFIHGILNGSYGATYFPTRFREALFHYSAQFDLLDATVPRESNERMLLERDIFGRSILNVVACEGADRVERPEIYKQWQLRNHRAGLRQLPLVPEVVKLVLDKVKDSYHKNFVVDVDQRWLVHRWKGRVLYAWSTWVANDVASTS
uniref:Uncharacterized protein n=1 Tax=Avena sativa TaxID=4498 RepID=A0ACD5VQM8_AVESA